MAFYRKPRISKDFLAEALCWADWIFPAVWRARSRSTSLEGHTEQAKATAGQYQDILGGQYSSWRFRTTKLGPDKLVCDAMLQMEKDLGIPLIATNDSHYHRCGRQAARTRYCSACRRRDR